MAVMVMCGGLAVGAVLNAVIPDDVFAVVASLATFATVLVWLMILASHISMRRKLTPEEVRRAEFRVPLWPWGSWLAVAVIVFVVVLLAWFPASRVAITVGIVWMAILSGWYLWNARRLRNGRQAG